MLVLRREEDRGFVGGGWGGMVRARGGFPFARLPPFLTTITITVTTIQPTEQCCSATPRRSPTASRRASPRRPASRRERDGERDSCPCGWVPRFSTLLAPLHV